MPTNQTISTTVSGPIHSNGAAIAVTSTGTINGGLTGVAALSFSITTLSNSGSILGGTGIGAGTGGAGVLNNQTITALINYGTIAGGNAGSTSDTFTGGAGGAGVANAGTVVTLTSKGTIRGGQGGFGIAVDGPGGAGVANSGTIGSAGVAGSGLRNTGSIFGGPGTSGGLSGSGGLDQPGDAGVVWRAHGG